MQLSAVGQRPASTVSDQRKSRSASIGWLEERRL